MNGPEHYQEAERLLERLAYAEDVGPSLARADSELIARRAVAHAQLAQAAASVQYMADGYTETVQAEEWRRVFVTEVPQ